jgi:hypothetical protein
MANIDPQLGRLMAHFEQHRDWMIEHYGLEGNGWWMTPSVVCNRYNHKRYDLEIKLTDPRRSAIWEELYVRANTFMIARYNSAEAAMIWKLSYARVHDN